MEFGMHSDERTSDCGSGSGGECPQPWLGSYPAGVPSTIDPATYPSLAELAEDSFQIHATLPAYKLLGKTLTFEELGSATKDFAAYLHSIGLSQGARVAVMLPNILQFPVAAIGVLRAGMVLVNVNPLYTPRELAHQLTDSGAEAIVVLENFAATFEQVSSQVPTKHVIIASMGDMLGPKGSLVNFVVRRIKKLVPAYRLEGHIRFNQALKLGRRQAFIPPRIAASDVALLQYTGGTTGISKGAILSHRNLIANVLQSEAWYRPAVENVPPSEQMHTVCALPLYHIFGFTAIMMLSMRLGGCNVLVPNPRDLDATLNELARHRIHSFPGINTLFNALARHPRFESVNWRSLVICVGGGMAVQKATAQLWMQKTGCCICEGYGLSETSPTVTCNPVTSQAYTGTIGVPLPSTEVKLLDESGREVPIGSPGEIAIRGPQVMLGYWQRDDETKNVMTADGFLRSGDIGVMDEQFRIRIVDRKKDMILVSGFNVYPNEVEDVLTQLDGVVEAAVVGVPDPHSGEAVVACIVRSRAELTEAEVRSHCEASLTGYKRPRHIEFRTELPKTTVGKILRRELRNDLQKPPQ